MTGLIVTVAALAIFAWAAIRVTEWIAGNDERIEAHTRAALDDAEADAAWADLLAAVGITPAEMRDRWEGRAR